jgi:hypothetical protein
LDDDKGRTPAKGEGPAVTPKVKAKKVSEPTIGIYFMFSLCHKFKSMLLKLPLIYIRVLNLQIFTIVGQLIG